MAQKPVLGKGLASLLPTMNPTSPPPSVMSGASVGATAAGPGIPASNESSQKDRHMGISMANVSDITANQFQPRRDFDDASLQELAQSIRTSGIIQPIVVRKTSEGFELIAGERRLRAAQLAGLKQVPIVIRKTTDREALELALVENIQRQDLNCIDEALAYFQLIQEFSLTQEEVADRVGKDRATVSNYLRLLRLPEQIILDLKRQLLTFGHGKALLGLEDADLRLRARAIVKEKNLSVRETEALVEEMKKENTAAGGEADLKRGSLSAVAKRLESLTQELTRHWSTKVEIKGSEKRGKIVLHYSTRSELDRIIEAMQTKST